MKSRSLRLSYLPLASCPVGAGMCNSYVRASQEGQGLRRGWRTHAHRHPQGLLLWMRPTSVVRGTCTGVSGHGTQVPTKWRGIRTSGFYYPGRNSKNLTYFIHLIHLSKLTNLINLITRKTLKRNRTQDNEQIDFKFYNCNISLEFFSLSFLISG